MKNCPGTEDNDHLTFAKPKLGGVGKKWQTGVIKRNLLDLFSIGAAFTFRH